MSKSPVYIGAGSAELSVQAAVNLIQDGIDSAAHLVTIADWVHADGTTVAGTAFYSAKEYAQGSTLAAGGSSKNWAQLITTPTTTAADASAKEWATGVSTHKLDASAKEYATHAQYGTVDGSSEYSAKHYSAQSKDWAAKTTIVRNDANGADVDYSSKQYAVGTPPDGSSKEWATTDTNAIAGGLFSAKQYAANSAASALAASNDLATFQSIFHGASTSTPSSNVSDGDLWFDTNTGVNVMKVYDLGNTTWVRTTPTTANQTQINTLTTGYDGTTTTSGTNLNIDQVDVVADNIGSVNTVATDIVKVVKVADDLLETVSEIETVALDLQETTSEIDTVANSIVNVNLVGDDIVKVNTVAGKDTEIGRIGTAPMAASIALLGTDAYANVSTGDIKLVADIDGDVTKVADIDDKVELVAAIDGEVELVAAVDGEIALLGTANMTHPTTGHLAYLGTAPMANTTNGYLKVLGNATVTDDMALLGATGVIGDIEIVSDNISDVNNFADQYQISAFAPAPALDGGGNSLAEGDLAFDTRVGEKGIKVWTGSAWSGGINTTEGVIVKKEYTANGSTQHYVLDHDQDMEIVYLNGVKLLSGDGSNNNDYFSVNGGSSTTYAGDGNTSTHIYFHTAPTNTFVISFVAWGASNNSLAVPISGGTYSGAVTFSAGLVTNTADINGGTLAAITIDGAWTAASQTCADLGTVTTGAFTTITNLGNVTTTGTIGLGGALTAGSNEIGGSNFDIDGGDISSVFISGGLTWNAPQNFDSKSLTNVNIDSGNISGVTISGAIISADLDWNSAQDFNNADFTNIDINSGDISGVTISGGLTWSAAQNLNHQDLTNVDINSGDISGVTISGGLTWSAAQDMNNVALTNVNIDSGTAILSGTLDVTGVSSFGQADAVTLNANTSVTVSSTVLTPHRLTDDGTLFLTATSGAIVAEIGTSSGHDFAVTEAGGSNAKFMVEGDTDLVSVPNGGDFLVSGDTTLSGTLTLSGAAENIRLGSSSLAGYESGSNYNVAIGYQALKHTLDDATHNIAIGTYAMDSTQGNYGSPYYTISGDHNIVMGYKAAKHITSGSNNVYMGKETANTAGSGSNNILIGEGNYDDMGKDHAIGIGHAVRPQEQSISIGWNSGTVASGWCRLGRSSNYIKVDMDVNATWSQSSDIRKKTDIESCGLGLSFIDDLRPTTFRFRPAEEHPEEWGHFEDELDDDGELVKRTYARMDTVKKHHGMIAQEVKEAVTAAGAEDYFAGWSVDENGCQNLGYSDFVLPLIKAVQELSAKVKALEAV